MNNREKSDQEEGIPLKIPIHILSVSYLILWPSWISRICFHMSLKRNKLPFCLFVQLKIFLVVLVVPLTFHLTSTCYRFILQYKSSAHEDIIKLCEVKLKSYTLQMYRI